MPESCFAHAFNAADGLFAARAVFSCLGKKENAPGLSRRAFSQFPSVRSRISTCAFRKPRGAQRRQRSEPAQRLVSEGARPLPAGAMTTNQNGHIRGRRRHAEVKKSRQSQINTGEFQDHLFSAVPVPLFLFPRFENQEHSKLRSLIYATNLENETLWH